MRVESSLADVLAGQQEAILRDWVREQVDSGSAWPDLIADKTHHAQCAAFLGELTRGVQAGDTETAKLKGHSRG